MTSKKELERLASLKARKTDFEQKIKDLQDKILKNRPPQKFETEYGTLVLQKRQDCSIEDNHKFLEESSMSSETFISYATLSGGKVKKLIGEVEFDQLKKSGIVKVGEQIQYYALKNRK